MQEIEDKENWSVFNGSYNEKPIITRIKIGFQNNQITQTYPFRLGIAVPLLHAEKNGLPAPQENIVFLNIEKYIVKQIEFSSLGVLCAVILTHGMKEFVFYISDNNIISIIKNLEREFPEYQFQHYIEEDEKWIGYHQLLEENHI